MFVRGLGVAVACALAAVLAAGCSSGDKPAALPSLTPSNSPSAAPSATSSATELAAVSAVVRQYYSLLNGATTLDNAAALAAIMTSDCTCQDVVRATKAAVLKHQHFFGTNHVVSVVPAIDGTTTAEALVTYDYTRSGIKDASGRVTSSGPGRRGTTQDFRLVKRDGRWLISAVLRVSAGKPS